MEQFLRLKALHITSSTFLYTEHSVWGKREQYREGRSCPFKRQFRSENGKWLELIPHRIFRALSHIPLPADTMNFNLESIGGATPPSSIPNNGIRLEASKMYNLWSGSFRKFPRRKTVLLNFSNKRIQLQGFRLIFILEDVNMFRWGPFYFYFSFKFFFFLSFLFIIIILQRY